MNTNIDNQGCSCAVLGKLMCNFGVKIGPKFVNSCDSRVSNIGGERHLGIWIITAIPRIFMDNTSLNYNGVLLLKDYMQENCGISPEKPIFGKFHWSAVWDRLATFCKQKIFFFGPLLHRDRKRYSDKISFFGTVRLVYTVTKLKRRCSVLNRTCPSVFKATLKLD